MATISTASPQLVNSLKSSDLQKSTIQLRRCLAPTKKQNYRNYPFKSIKTHTKFAQFYDFSEIKCPVS